LKSSEIDRVAVGPFGPGLVRENPQIRAGIQRPDLRDLVDADHRAALRAGEIPAAWLVDNVGHRIPKQVFKLVGQCIIPALPALGKAA